MATCSLKTCQSFLKVDLVMSTYMLLGFLLILILSCINSSGNRFFYLQYLSVIMDEIYLPIAVFGQVYCKKLHVLVHVYGN